MHPPALALIQTGSIARGIAVADAMAKSAPLDGLRAGTVHPGGYLVLVSGPLAAVEAAMQSGRERANRDALDEVTLPHPHPDLWLAVQDAGSDAVAESRWPGPALGAVETRTVPCLLLAVDKALKGAQLRLAELRLADDLGGKSYALLSGEAGDVEEGIDLARASLGERLLATEVMARLDPDLNQELDRRSRFFARGSTT